MRNFEELVYERFCIIFGMVVLGQLICITFVRSSLDNFKDNSGDNHFISSLVVFFFFLIIISFLKISCLNNYLTHFLLIISYTYNYFTPFLCPPTWIWKNKLTCFFSCSWHLYQIQIKVDIDRSIDKLLKNMWEHC
jgi:hypothetical protein